MSWRTDQSGCRWSKARRCARLLTQSFSIETSLHTQHGSIMLSVYLNKGGKRKRSGSDNTACLVQMFGTHVTAKGGKQYTHTYSKRTRESRSGACCGGGYVSDDYECAGRGISGRHHDAALALCRGTACW